MYPALLDSNRPREEWNISHVKTESLPTTPITEPPTKQQIITTHEEELVALNKVLKENLATEEESDGRSYVFQRVARAREPTSAQLADQMMIAEIGSEQKTNGTTSTEKKQIQVNRSSDFELDNEEVKIDYKE